MNFINAATKKERTHVEEIIKSSPVMPHEGITATEIGICGKQNLFMDVYRPDNDAEKHPIIIDIHGGGLIAGRKEQNQNLATWFAKEGYLTFVPDYRLVPETNVFGQITDVINAFATVAECAEDFGGDLNQVFVVADSAGAFLACMASSILRYPVKMQPVEDELEENVPEAAKKLVINAMGLQSGMYYIYKGQVGLLQNYYMSKGWKNHSYAEFIKPETYSKLIPPCYICTGKKDFLKKQTFGFKKCLENERVHHDYGFVSKRETVHAFAALYPETESAVGVNREMIRFFDTFKK